MQFKIGSNEADQRIDRFLRKYFKKYPEVKLSDIFAWLRKGVIKVNGNKVKQNYRLKEGDVIVFLSDIEDIFKKPQEVILDKNEKKLKVSLKDIENMIIYEDENWIVFNKPAGLVVHPGNKHENDLTLTDLLDIYSQYKKLQTTTFKPSFAFRLDRDTSGIIIAGKNYEALKYLNDLIRQRRTDKTYLTVVKGKAPNHKIIDFPLFRGFNRKFGRAQSFVNWERGQSAKTEIWRLANKKLEEVGDISLVKVKIYTGRMHQIRVHLSHIGHFVVGDIMYGDEKINKFFKDKYKITRQLLHSWKYGFFDKFKNKYILFEAPVSDDFNKLFAI